MIQIITGTFGYYDGRKVVPITHEDGPKQFDPDLEARLVKAGIAQYVDGAKASEDDPTKNDGLPEYNESMKLAELKKIAAAYGVDASKMKAKADVIAAIEATKEEVDDDDDDDAEPPQIDVAEPV